MTLQKYLQKGCGRRVTDAVQCAGCWVRGGEKRDTSHSPAKIRDESFFDLTLFWFACMFQRESRNRAQVCVVTLG